MPWGDGVSVNKHSAVTRALGGCVAVNMLVSHRRTPLHTCKTSLAAEGQVYIYPFESRQHLGAHSVCSPGMASGTCSGVMPCCISVLGRITFSLVSELWAQEAVLGYRVLRSCGCEGPACWEQWVVGGGQWGDEEKSLAEPPGVAPAAWELCESHRSCCAPCSSRGTVGFVLQRQPELEHGTSHQLSSHPQHISNIARNLPFFRPRLAVRKCCLATALGFAPRHGDVTGPQEPSAVLHRLSRVWPRAAPQLR